MFNGIFAYFCMLFLLLIASSLFICGWFAITRGDERVMPDGTIKRSGKLLKGWYFWFFQKTGDYSVYRYTDERLDFLYLKLKQHGWDYLANQPLTALMKAKLEDSLDIRIEARAPASLITLYYFYEQEPNYVFPEWVRQMMAGCITCHASLYGSICFWTFHFLFGKEHLRTTMYAAADGNFGLMLVVTWVAFCIMLSFVVTKMWKSL